MTTPSSSTTTLAHRLPSRYGAPTPVSVWMLPPTRPQCRFVLFCFPYTCACINLPSQIATANSIFNATNPIGRKKSQGGHAAHYTDHSCVTVGLESWIDAINHPEWGVDEVYGPGKDYLWEGKYAFSVIKS
jgi:hypothetical protein